MSRSDETNARRVHAWLISWALGLAACSPDSEMMAGDTDAGSTDGTATDETNPDSSMGDAGTGVDDSCEALELAPIPASPITWSGVPACDPSSGFCIVSPTPVHALGKAGMSPTGTAFTVATNIVASWKDGLGDVHRIATDDLLGDVLPLSDTDVWVVGSDSTVGHFDGTTWTLDRLDHGSWLSALWASAPDDVWAVGNFGVVGHHDGTAWTSVRLSGEPSLTDVAGTGPDDVWAVGWDGAVVHWDGATWTKVPVEPKRHFEAVWATSPDDVWIVGRNGAVLHGNLQGFSLVEIPVVTYDKNLYGDVWGSSPSDVWVLGSWDMLHFDGSSWTRFDPVGHSIMGRSADDVVLLGDAALRWNGADWIEEFSLGQPELNAAWAVSEDDIWFAGDDGLVIRFVDGQFLRGDLDGQTINSIWASGGDDIWLATSNRLYRGDGETFCVVQVPASFSNQSISGSDPTNVWLTKALGEVLHFDGSEWTSMGDVDADWILSFSPSDTWAAGDGLRHWDGTQWTTHFNGGTGGRCGPPWGAAPDDIWVARGTSMMHWDGTSWSIGGSGSNNAALSGSASNDVWAIDSAVRHFDGLQWNDIPSGRLPINAVAVTSTDVWAAGARGLIARRTK